MSLTDDLTRLGIKLAPVFKDYAPGHKPRTHKYVRTESSIRHANNQHALTAADQHALDRAAGKRIRKKVNVIIASRKGAFVFTAKKDRQ